MIAKGLRRRVPTLFAPAGPSACRIAPGLIPVPEPAPHRCARAPPREGCIPVPLKIAMKSRAGAPTIPSPDMLLGQRSDPASPAETKLPPESAEQGDWQ
jgi:hypothetical protein